MNGPARYGTNMNSMPYWQLIGYGRIHKGRVSHTYGKYTLRPVDDDFRPFQAKVSTRHSCEPHDYLLSLANRVAMRAKVKATTSIVVALSTQ